MLRAPVQTLLILSLATGLQAQDAEYAFGGVTFPAEVAEFEVMRTSRWPDPALGVALTYLKDGTPAEFSVYVYPATKELKAEFDTSMEGIRVYAAQNRNQIEVEFESEEPVEISGHPGFLGSTTMRARGAARRSLLYVFEKDGHSVKYRISFDQSMRTLLEPVVDEFVAATLERIGVPDGARDSGGAER